MVSSYVDDGGILVATRKIESTKDRFKLVECWEDCDKVAKSRGMGFASSKMDWIGFSEEDWGMLRIGEEELKEVKEIRILGYRMDKRRSMGVHMEYWSDRGIGVKRRIAGLGRRFGSHGGLGARECLRLIQGVYMPTVYYGLEFVSKDKKLIKEIQTNLNDTLRSTFRSPRKYANKILIAETGTVPTHIEGRYRERKGYGRHQKYKYGGNLPWFGCIAEKWKDDRLKEEMQWSNKNLLRRPNVRIAHTKEAAIKEHAERWEDGPGQEVWVYSDGSKRKDEVAMAWVKMGGEEMVEEELGMRVPGDWSILKAEVAGIGMALRDMRRWGGRSIKVFSDSASGLKMIRDMEKEGNSASLWDMMTGALNEWEEVELVWVPGHSRIPGNEAADKKAKALRNRKLNENGRWKEVDYDTGMKAKCDEWRREEWKEWHDKEGHDYYKRDPKKPKHMKCMTRRDYYVLMRIRSGADNRGHENCQFGKNRFYLINCTMYEDERPEPESVFDDRKINEWKRWWTKYDYLGMGIPTNLPEQIDTRVMFGNFFDGTLTIERHGERIIERVDNQTRSQCDKIHNGGCMKEVTNLTGRWFFIKDNQMDCDACGGKFGGGSTSRSGGSGLKDHAKRNKKCGPILEREFWRQIVKRWAELEKEYKLALVMKWIGKEGGGLNTRINCVGCGNDILVKSLKIHVRVMEKCYEKWAEEMIEYWLGQ